ncbi:non-ribosomal peptide synthetase [Paenibacillus tengchongensis]|uniref:non-ribosomal peptide synthetase n=1 Tax=Paenibacillus tengchongensis TaxID=2608684 RepID=UPI00124D37CA|nr:non-ribosomal peptide synthetase [Paenibacillus tengchongensis]
MNKGNVSDIYGLTTMQEGMLYHSLKSASTSMYLEQFSCLLNGRLQPGYFWQAWQSVIDGNPALRTAFMWEGLKKPVQVVLKECGCRYIQYDWRHLPPEERERSYRSFLENDRELGFELGEAPLMRFALIQLTDSSSYFVWSFHHLVMDGWSLPLVLGQMLEHYKSLREGRTPALDHRNSFKAYIQWVQKQDAQATLAYWRQQLEGFEEMLQLTGEPNGELRGENRKQSLRLSTALYTDIEAAAKRHGLTSYQIYNAAYALLLGKYSGTDDVVYGTTVSGRPMDLPGIEQAVGLFINTVPVRVRLERGLTVLDVLEQLSQAQAARSRHEYISLAEIGSAVNLPQLFQSIFVYENYANAEAYKTIAEFSITDLELREEINYPLAWVVKPDDGICVETVYDSACFSDELIGQFQQSYVQVLQDMIHKMQEPVHAVTLTGEEAAAYRTSAVVVNLRQEPCSGLDPADFAGVRIADKEGHALPDGFYGRVMQAGADGPQDTGYTGRFCPDGTLQINETLSTVMKIGGVRRDLATLERKLLAEGLADDVKLVHRCNLEGESKLVVYYAEPVAEGLGDVQSDYEARTGAVRQALLNLLAVQLGISADTCAALTDFVHVSAIPYYASGEVKLGELLKLEVINGNLLGRWSSMLSGETGGGTAAAAAGTSTGPFFRRAVKPHRDKVHISELVEQYSFIGKGSGQAKDGLGNAVDAQPERGGTAALSLISGEELSIPEDTVFDLGYYIKRAAERAPEEQGIRFIGYDGSITFAGYRQIYEEARAILAGLALHGLKPGDKVIYQMDDNRNYVTVFWACMLGGLIGVPVTVASSYREDNAAVRKLYNAWKMLDRPVIVTDAVLASGVRGVPAVLGEGDELDVYTAEALRSSPAWEPGTAAYEVKPDDLALLLLTSGSTGMPKAVMQSHRNLICRTIAGVSGNGFGPEEVTFNWMPMDHVGGTVMCNVRDVYLHCNEILAPVNYILEAPLRWLSIMSDYKVTNTWAPNFAYNLINSHEHELKTLELDLSRLRVITNGGEVVVARTALKFIDLMQPYGLDKAAMKPCFGMSETCSGIIYSRDFADGIVQPEDTRVSVGYPLGGHMVRVVDAQDELLPLYTEGRFQIKGLAVTPGYYNNPKANAEAFTRDGWFDTGDLGMISDRGLTITGRAKDIIIINGVNYNNSDIEAVLEEIDGVEVSYTAAVTVKPAGAGAEQLAVFFHPSSMDGPQLRNVMKEMQRSITAKIGVVIEYLVPLPKKDIPKTAIGKIQRILLRDSLLDGKYDAVLRQVELLRDINTVKPWTFGRVWQPLGFRQEPQDLSAAAFLVFADDAGLAAAFAGLLGPDAAGRLVTVSRGDSFTVAGPGHIVCDYSNGGGCGELFAHLAGIGWRASHIVYLAGYEPAASGRMGLTESSRLGVYGLLPLVQTLADHGLCASTSLTVGAANVYQGVSGREPHADQASLIGFIAALQMENTGLSSALVDLEGSDSLLDASCLLDEIRHEGNGGREISYRNGRRLAGMLKHLPLQPGDPNVQLKRGGRYVVTGGLGGIGTVLCRKLIADYAAELLIVGRSGLELLGEDDARVRNYRSLAGSGAAVSYARADVCDLAALQAAITDYEQRAGGAIDGVLHLAGNSSYQRHLDHRDAYWITAGDREAFAEEFDAKVYGTQNLFRVIQERKGAVMIAFSSVTSFLGSATFSAYSAANSFLEMFCQHAAEVQGYPVKCISWTMWDNIGMTAGNLQSINILSESIGQHVIGEQDGLLLFEAAIRMKGALIYAGIDEHNRQMKRRIAEKTYGMDMLAVSLDETQGGGLRLENARLIDDYGALSTVRVFTGDSGFGAMDGGEESGYSAAATGTEVTIHEIWSEVLGLRRIGMADNFFELGGHSLRATQVVSRIKKAYEVPFAINDLFYYPTIGELAAVIDGRMAELNQTEGGGSIAVLSEEEKRRGIPVSYAQQRLWFLRQYDEDSAFYNILEAVRLEGALKVDCLRQAVTEIVKRHDGLRTTFANVEGQVLQILHEAREVEVPLQDLTAVQPENREAVLKELADAEVARAFDFEHGPLLRCRLLKFAEDEHIIFLTMHHIVSDGWSMGVFVEEFVTLYEALAEQKPLRLPRVEWQYADYAAWQRGWFTGEVKQRQFDYWKNKLQDIATLDIPADYDRPKVQTYNGRKEFFTYSPELMRSVGHLAESTGATPFMIYLAAVNVLLSRYTGQEDIAIGTPIANRTRKETEHTIGFFVNTLVLRSDLSGELSFLELVERVKATALESYDAQDMPFEMLVDELNLERDLSRNPLFQVMFALQNEELPDFRLPGLNISRIETDNRSAMFDFWISMRELEDGVYALCEYNTDIYKRETVVRMMRHLENILVSLCGDPSQDVKRFNYMDKEEIQEVVYGMNATEERFASGLFIHESFEAQADLRPDAPAVSFEGMTLTYRELNERVNRIAHYLLAQGIGREDFVGVYAERSIEMVAAIYGILKAGAAYVPIDPTYPQERIDYVLEDSEVKLVLVCAGEASFPEGITAVDLRDYPLFEAYSTANPGVQVAEQDAAYMIYTSGSTGKPKGTVNVHSGIRNRILWGQRQFGMQPGDRQLQKTPFSFDVSCSEIFWAPTAGACLVIARPEGHKDVDYLIEVIRDERITFCHFVPSILKLFLDHPGVGQAATSLKKVFCSGEALPYRLKEQFFATLHAEMHNLYGPTEASVEVSHYDCSEALDKEIVPIGRPIANVQLYVLDRFMNPVPYNVGGELYIAGVNLARGYYKREELSAERFIPNPFSKYASARMYKTGDIVKLLPDGNIHFIGRADNQVKIRGLRVELGEIEKVIQSHPSVKDNVVLARESGGDVRIVSYIVRDEEYQVQAAEEGGREQVDRWETVFDHAYNHDAALQDFSLNTVSWNSSYTGENIPLAEMEEWLADSVDVIRGLKPRKVLEIGVGTGMILFKIAPLCDEYVGVDLSRVGLDYIENHLDGTMKVRLYQKAADGLGELLEERFDTIILNSVIQYFPNGDYLDRVIHTLLGILSPGGHLFIGDVRSLALLHSYHTSVELYKAPGDLTVPELQERIRAAVADENELLVDSKYFLSLKETETRVGHVAVLPKMTRYGNEMSKFRYQVVIGTGEAQMLANLVRLDGRELDTSRGLSGILAGCSDEVILIDHLPLGRLVYENNAEALLAAEAAGSSTVNELKARLEADPAVNIQLDGGRPAELFQDIHGQDGEYAVLPRWNGHSANGDYQLLLLRKDKLPAEGSNYQFEVPHTLRFSGDKSIYFTNPLEWKNNLEYVPLLREHVRQSLQEYMIPSHFMVLEQMPLLPSGKLNLKALPEPENTRRNVLTEYADAASDTEKRVKQIWEAVLGAGNIGVNDNFFDIGGHSLLVLQVYYQIKEAFGTSLTVVDMFKYPTIRSLCEVLEQASGSFAEVAAVSEQAQSGKEAMREKRRRLKELMK